MEKNARGKLPDIQRTVEINSKVERVWQAVTEFTVIHSGWGEPDEIIPRVQQKQAVIRERMYECWGHMTKGLRDNLDKDDE